VQHTDNLREVYPNGFDAAGYRKSRRTYPDAFRGFSQALADAGFEISGPIVITTDTPVRCRVNRSKDKDGWYHFKLFRTHDGGEIGYGSYFDWRDGYGHTKWQSTKDGEIEPQDLTRFRAERKRLEEKTKLAQAKGRDDAAIRAQEHVAKAVPAIEHPYLTAKDVKPHGILECNGELVVPMRNSNGEVRSYQRIQADGTKRYMKGGQKNGLYYLIGNPDKRVYIVEGFATGATVHELTGKAVVVAFDTSGLKPALAEFRKVYAGRIVFAADNDRLKTDAGRVAAEKAAKGDPLCSVIVAEFPDDEGTDFNDLAAADPVEAKRQLLVGQHEFTYQSFKECLPVFRSKERAEKEIAYKDACEHITTMGPVEATAAINNLKSASGVNKSTIRKSIAECNAKTPDLTHGQMAEKFHKKLQQHSPTVGCYGKAWQYDGVSVWTETPLSLVGQAIGEAYAIEPLCKRASDYKAISGEFYTRAADECFFTDAPTGVVCPEGFYAVEGDQLTLAPHKPSNRARFQLPFDPDPSHAPERFLKLLRDAFGDHDPEGQIRVLQQYFGLAVMGLQYQTQTAVLLYGAGGSGKGVVQAVLKALLPDIAVSTVSPHDFDNEYSRAVVASKRLNLCSELDHDKPIPAAQFKAMTGGDPQNGREPYGMPFTFRPTCGVWINSNFYPVTKDRSDGFWRRWAIIYFATGRTAEQRNPNLEAEILEHEMGAVLAWALKGAADYLANDRRVEMSLEHHRQMNMWKSEANSVTGWLEDMDSSGLVFASAASIRVADAYELYRGWCQKVGKRPYIKQSFINVMDDEGHCQMKSSVYVFKGIGKAPYGAGIHRLCS
jgi:P4 family phage/plasmid primase-like protien